MHCAIADVRPGCTMETCHGKRPVPSKLGQTVPRGCATPTKDTHVVPRMCATSSPRATGTCRAGVPRSCATSRARGIKACQSCAVETRHDERATSHTVPHACAPNTQGAHDGFPFHASHGLCHKDGPGRAPRLAKCHATCSRHTRCPCCARRPPHACSPGAAGGT